MNRKVVKIYGVPCSYSVSTVHYCCIAPVKPFTTYTVIYMFCRQCLISYLAFCKLTAFSLYLHTVKKKSLQIVYEIKSEYPHVKKVAFEKIIVIFVKHSNQLHYETVTLNLAVG